MKTQNLKTLAILATLAGSALVASATPVSGSATGTIQGNSVDASYSIAVTSLGTITVTLNNLIVDPTAVIQNISGISFNVSNGSTSGASTANSGNLVDINSSGVIDSGPTASTLSGWGLSQSGLNLYLSSLPGTTIIGAPGAGGTYDQANGSIAGNGPHNPFVYLTATFTITDAGVNADTLFSGVTLYFGTGPTPLTPNGPPPSAPDGGSTMVLLGIAGLGIFAFVRKAKLA